MKTEEVKVGMDTMLSSICLGYYKTPHTCQELFGYSLSSRSRNRVAMRCSESLFSLESCLPSPRDCAAGPLGTLLTPMQIGKTGNAI